MKTLLLTLLLFISCKREPVEIKTEHRVSDTTRVKGTSTDNTKDLNGKFEKYLSSSQVQPIAIINNVDINRTDITIEGHRIKWIDSEEETKVKIDDDIFTLDNYTTINDVTDDGKDSLDFPNNWEQIKFYRYYDGKPRDIILITMNYTICSGLGCSAEYILIYDCTTKTKNFFGSFRGSHIGELYNFGDGKLCYLSNTYKGDFNGATPIEFINNIYKFNNDGIFSIMNDNNGELYFSKSKWHPDNNTYKFEVNWPYKIH